MSKQPSDQEVENLAAEVVRQLIRLTNTDGLRWSLDGPDGRFYLTGLYTTVNLHYPTTSESAAAFVYFDLGADVGLTVQTQDTAHLLEAVRQQRNRKRSRRLADLLKQLKGI